MGTKGMERACHPVRLKPKTNPGKQSFGASFVMIGEESGCRGLVVLWLGARDDLLVRLLALLQQNFYVPALDPVSPPAS